MRQLLVIVAASILPLLLVAGFACGDVITETEQISTATQLDLHFQLPQFNPALGTLTSVTLSADFTSMTPELFLSNSGNTAVSGVTVSGKMNGSVGFEGPDGSQIWTPDPNGGLTYPLVSNPSGTKEAGAPAYGGTFTSVTVPANGNYFLVDSSQVYSDSTEAPVVLTSGLSPYTGTGNATFSLITMTTSSIGNVSSWPTITTGASFLGAGTYEVQYTYTPAAVPEPSTLVLLGLGAVSMIAYAWRKRRTA